MSTHFPMRKLVQPTMALALGISALSLVSCGGGDEGTESGVAPESLEEVTIDFFGAFKMDFRRLSGDAGNEKGSATYTRSAQLDSIFWDSQASYFSYDANGSSYDGTRIILPDSLSQIQYDYVRTGADSARITIDFVNNHNHPLYDETFDYYYSFFIDDDRYGDMFWGGHEQTATSLVVDILFASNSNNVITDTSAKVRSAYRITSVFEGIDEDSSDYIYTNTITPFDLNSSDLDLTFTNSGAYVNAGYNPYSGDLDSTPSSVVWESLKGRTVTFEGADTVSRSISFQSTDTGGPQIPEVSTPEEGGSFIMDMPSQNLYGVFGRYSYARTGGIDAKLALEVGTDPVIIMDMAFGSNESGTYVDSESVSGEFVQDFYDPN